MSTVKTRTVNVGRVPAYCGEWDENFNLGRGYYKQNIVSFNGSSFISTVDGNKNVPATFVHDSSGKLLSYTLNKNWNSIANVFDTSVLSPYVTDDINYDSSAYALSTKGAYETLFNNINHGIWFLEEPEIIYPFVNEENKSGCKITIPQLRQAYQIYLDGKYISNQSEVQNFLDSSTEIIIKNSNETNLSGTYYIIYNHETKEWVAREYWRSKKLLNDNEYLFCVIQFMVNNTISIKEIHTLKYSINGEKYNCYSPDQTYIFDNYFNLLYEHICESTEDVPFDVLSRKIFVYPNELRNSSACDIYKYTVDGDTWYRYSCQIPATENIYYLTWLDENCMPIINDPRGGVYNSKPAKNVFVKSPENAKYAYLNVRDTYKNQCSFEKVVFSNKIEKLIDQSESFLVHIYSFDGTRGTWAFYVRSSLNDQKDVIQLFCYHGNNGNITPLRVYVCEKSELSKDVVTSSDYSHRVFECSDSTGPLSGSQFWSIFQQHGYCIPYIPIENIINGSSSFEDSDINTTVIDQLNRKYTIGFYQKNSSNEIEAIYLMPVWYKDEKNNNIRDWYGNTNDNPILELTQISSSPGKHWSINWNVNPSYRIQLGPIVDFKDRKFFINGNEITKPGDYSCTNFSVSENRIGYDPATINQWFNDNKVDISFENAEELANFTWSYNFTKNNYNAHCTIDLKKAIKFNWFKPTQQQYCYDIDFRPTGCNLGGNYKAMYFLPKTKNYETPFNYKNINSTEYNIHLYRRINDLKDINKLPDRCIMYLQDKNNPNSSLFGMSSGYSLINGGTSLEKYGNNIPVCETDSLAEGKSNFIHFWNSEQGPKLYHAAMNAQMFKDNDYWVPDTYFNEFNYYVSFFDPTKNNNTEFNYWYKENDDYIIYLHSFDYVNKEYIDVPTSAEGYTLSIIEKTDGAELLSDVVQNGKIFVRYNDENSLNYLVIKASPIFINQKNVELPDNLNDTLNRLTSDSPYNDPNVLKYVTDDNNYVIAEIKKNGEFVKFVKTKEEKEIEKLLSRVSSESLYDDPNVLKYIIDDNNTCIGYISIDGTVNLFKVKIHEKENDNKDLFNVIGMLANTCDNVAMTNNKKMMSTLKNIETNTRVQLNEKNNNNKNLTPLLSIIDDDTIDKQIPSSFNPSASPSSNTGGYFSVLLPIMLSLSKKHNAAEILKVGLASEGQRIGFTSLASEDDSSVELNENGVAVKWLHDNVGWNVFNHSMTAQLPIRTFVVDDINSSTANSILEHGTFVSERSFNNTIVYDKSTGNWYEPKDSNLNEWVLRTPFKKYAMPFYFEYQGIDPSTNKNKDGVITDMYFNRDFDFEYSWGEWFKRADRLGFPYEKVIVHNGNTSSVYMCNAGRKYANWSIRTDGTHNYPPIPAMVNRISDAANYDIVNGTRIIQDNNIKKNHYEEKLKSEIDYCIQNNTWMVLMTHINEMKHNNFYDPSLNYPEKDQNYNDEWIIPLNHNEIISIINGDASNYIETPPSRLNITSWDEWYPAPGTQLKTLYDVLDYALENGVKIVSPMDGWNSHGNVLNIGVDLNGQINQYDNAKNNTPFTDDEQSYLTIGGDLSIRYYNKNSNNN